jgi:F-type H+-transporting ATPase subunit delta
MAELATLSRPYANAVFELAQSAGNLETWSKTLDTLVATSLDELVQTMLNSPDLAATDKAAQLAALCGDEIDGQAAPFLQALAEHDRLALLPEVRDQFEALRAEQEQTLDVEIVAAYELTQAQSDSLKAALHAKYNKEINISSRVDQGLVGGAIIRAGDIVIDGSVKGRLTKLVETLVQK